MHLKVHLVIREHAYLAALMITIIERTLLKGIDASADVFEYVGDNMVARGHVVLCTPEMQLTADRAVIHLPTRDVEAFGNWPGAAVGGEQTVGGVNYKYFNGPADAAGKTLNLILNNNTGGSQYDVARIVAGKDYFYTANPDGAVEK